MKSIDYWIEKLQLEIHPEGGYFKETFRSTEKLKSLPERYIGERNYYTVIYYLLPGNQFSSFHRMVTDEAWFFHEGCPIQLFVLKPEELEVVKLGKEFKKGESWQYLVPANHWFAAKPVSIDLYSLVSCVVAPGFDFSDWELGEKDQLIKEFPEYKEVIINYSR